jgi:hypothetical protein
MCVRRGGGAARRPTWLRSTLRASQSTGTGPPCRSTVPPWPCNRLRSWSESSSSTRSSGSWPPLGRARVGRCSGRGPQGSGSPACSRRAGGGARFACALSARRRAGARAASASCGSSWSPGAGRAEAAAVARPFLALELGRPRARARNSGIARPQSEQEPLHGLRRRHHHGLVAIALEEARGPACAAQPAGQPARREQPLLGRRRALLEELL